MEDAMHLITGATGKTGSAAARELLKRKQKVRVLVRSRDKGQPWEQQGAEVALGDMADPATYGPALTGVTSVYFLVPSHAQSTDLVGGGHRVVDAFVGALGKSDVEHVVLLSSIGAQHERGTGPIQIVAYAERSLATTRKPVTSIRASYFMENALSMMPLMRAQGILPASIDPALEIPMVASADIGALAAEVLGEPQRNAGVIELGGPSLVSYAQVAAACSEALGKPVNAVHVPRPGVVPALMQAGFSENVAGLYAEMAGAIESGLVAFEGGHRQVKGPTTLQSLVKQMV
jgi:uncharacterized protein YbjT (DUF2867 family)